MALNNKYGKIFFILLILSLILTINVGASYPTWEPDVTYTSGDIVYYDVNQKHYEVLQDHTSASHWTPDTATSLYAETSIETCEEYEFCEGEQVNVDDIIQYEGIYYRVIQEHTTQSDWKPNIVPALFEPFLYEEQGKLIINKYNISIEYLEDTNYTLDDVLKGAELTRHSDNDFTIKVNSENYSNLNKSAKVKVKNANFIGTPSVYKITYEEVTEERPIYDENNDSKIIGYENVTYEKKNREYVGPATKETEGTYTFNVQGFSEYSLTDGLSIYLDGSYSGSTAFDVHASNDGTASNDRVFGSVGKIGDGFDFTQGDDSIELPWIYLNNNNKFSVSTWFKRGTISGEQTIINRWITSGGSANARWGLTFLGDNDLKVMIGSDNTWRTVKTNIDTKWHHVVLTYDGNTAKVYLDGVEEISFSTTYAEYSTLQYNNIIRLGKFITSSHFNGDIDEFAIYNRDLSSAEVSNLYNNGDGKTYEDLKNFTVTALNANTNETLTDFNVTVNETTYTTTTGSVETEINDDSLQDVTVCAENYLCKTYYDWNTSNDLQANLTFDTSVLLEGLVSYWDFNEGSGTTATDIHGTNDVTLLNGASFTSSGKLNNSLSLSGSSKQYARSDNSISLSSDFSVGGWFKNNLAGVPDQRYYLSNDYTKDNTFILFQEINSARLEILMRKGNNNYFISSNYIPSSDWEHVFIVREGSNIKVYVNGVAVIDDTSPNNDFSMNERLDIGYATTRNADESEFDGNIDEVLIYNRALSSSEVSELSQDPPPSYDSFDVEEITVTTDVMTTETTSTSIKVYGTLEDLAGYNSSDVYFQYREEGTTTWLETNKTTITTNMTQFSETLTPLNYNTTYEYRAVAEWNDGNDSTTGITRTFTTLGVTISEPTIYEGKTYNDEYYKENISITSQIENFTDTQCEYTIDNAATWNTASNNLTHCYKENIEPNTDINIKFRARSGSTTDWVESTNKNYIYDAASPDNLELTPASRDWLNTNITINISATDAGSGINESTYEYCTTTDTSCTPNTTGTQINISEEGEWTACFTVYDNIENGASTCSTANAYKIDKTNPTSTGEVTTGSTLEGVYYTDVEYTITSEDSLSGVNRTYYCQDTDDTCTPNTLYVEPIIIDTDGDHYIRFNSTDNAENQETIQSSGLIERNESLLPYFTISLEDIVTTTLIDNFSVEVNGTSYTTTNGTIITDIDIDSGLFDVYFYDIQNHYEFTKTNVNTSEHYSGRAIGKSYKNEGAILNDKITDINITEYNLTITNQNHTTETADVEIQSQGYKNKTITNQDLNTTINETLIKPLYQNNGAILIDTYSKEEITTYNLTLTNIDYEAETADILIEPLDYYNKTLTTYDLNTEINEEMTQAYLDIKVTEKYTGENITNFKFDINGNVYYYDIDSFEEDSEGWDSPSSIERSDEWSSDGNWSLKLEALGSSLAAITEEVYKIVNLTKIETIIYDMNITKIIGDETKVEIQYKEAGNCDSSMGYTTYKTYEEGENGTYINNTIDVDELNGEYCIKYSATSGYSSGYDAITYIDNIRFKEKKTIDDLPFPVSQGERNVTIRANDYLNRTGVITVSPLTTFELETELWQAETTFNAYNELEEEITNFNVTINNETKNNTETWELLSQEYNATFSKTGYYNKTINITPETQEIKTYNFTGIYQGQATFDAYNMNNEELTNFNVTIDGVTKNNTETWQLEEKEYNATFSKTGYYNKTINITIEPETTTNYNYTDTYQSRVHITAADVKETEPINVFTIEYRGENYPTINGTVYINAMNTENISITGINDIYFEKTLLNQDVSNETLVMQIDTKPRIRAYDVDDNLLSNYELNFYPTGAEFAASTTISTTGDEIYTELLGNYTITFLKDEWLSKKFNKTLEINQDYNLTDLSQTAITFEAYDLIENEITNFNVTIDGVTKTNNEIFDLTEGVYEVEFSKDGWYNKTIYITVEPLSTDVHKIINLYQTQTTLTARDVKEDTLINNYTVYSQYLKHEDFINSTSGTIEYKDANNYKLYYKNEFYDVPDDENSCVEHGEFEYSVEGGDLMCKYTDSETVVAIPDYNENGAYLVQEGITYNTTTGEQIINTTNTFYNMRVTSSQDKHISKYYSYNNPIDLSTSTKEIPIDTKPLIRVYNIENATINNFTVTVDDSPSFAGIGGAEPNIIEQNTTTGEMYLDTTPIPLGELVDSTISSNTYFNQTHEEITYEENTDYNYTGLYQVLVDVNAYDVRRQPISDFSYRYNDSDYFHVEEEISEQKEFLFGTYTFYFNETNAIPKNKTVTLDEKEEKTVTFENIGYQSTLNLVDEETLEPFDLTPTEEVKLLIYCQRPDRTEEYIIDDNQYELNLTCEYEKIKFQIDYGEGTSYYRNIIMPDGEIYNQTIYLIDGNDTFFLFSSFQIDDLLGKYRDPSIWVKKRVEDETVTIQSDFTDIENKVGVYLIREAEYIIELHSENKPVEIIGTYTADQPAEKTINMYDVSLATNETLGFYQNVIATTRQINDSGTKSIQYYYSDPENRTEELTFILYVDNENSTPIYTSPTYTYTPTAEYLLAIPEEYENETVVAQIEILHEEIGEDTITRYHNKNYKINPTILDHIDQEFMNWFLLIILSIIAIYSNIKTTGAGLAVTLFAFVFVLFGWLQISMALLAVAILISFIEFMAKQR